MKTDPVSPRRRAAIRPAFLFGIGLALALTLPLPRPSCAQTISVPTLGFEDDVDVLVAPGGEFMLVCEETPDGADARLRIIDLNPATGQPVGVLFLEEDILGFEDAVDPIMINQEGDPPGYLILVPTENEDGTLAKLIKLYTTPLGFVIWRHDNDLAELGFRPDVDLIWGDYNESIAVVPLESEDHLVRGLMAIDVDNSDGDWGTCRLLSTDGRDGCVRGEFAPWLPGLADGVDPIVYRFDDAFRVALPVKPEVGDGDLLFVDFDSDVAPTNEPPVLVRHQSVKQLNETGPRPVSFPGFEVDVDMILLEAGECGFGRSLLVPVEAPGGAGDVYLIDTDSGTVHWKLSVDGAANGLPVPGFEAGVDLLAMTGLPVAPVNRVAVPWENAAGNDAGLYLVDIDTGLLAADVEDPTRNPGLSLSGYEVGVDLLRWAGTLVAPQEGSGAAGGGSPGLLVFQPNGLLLSSALNPSLMGYRRSVDPIVALLTPPRLVVPIAKDDGTSADVLVFPSPPNLAIVYSVEAENPGLVLGPCMWDVDLGIVDKTLPGQLYLCVPEESPTGAPNRLRFELTAGPPGNRVLALATQVAGALPASLYLVDLVTGDVVLEKHDGFGLEGGLDMVNGRGPVTPEPERMPVFPRATGFDPDSDPTLMWVTAPAPVQDPAPVPAAKAVLSHANPFAPPDRIRFELPASGPVELAIVDVTGRRVRKLAGGVRAAGAHTVTWDGRDDRGQRAPAGVYFVALKSAGATAFGKLVLLE
jgi:hypothetical protein